VATTRNTLVSIEAFGGEQSLSSVAQYHVPTLVHFATSFLVRRSVQNPLRTDAKRVALSGFRSSSGPQFVEREGRNSGVPV